MKSCSKCGVVKNADCFYATGRVCKECKKDYARKYRGSKACETQSFDDSASVRTDDTRYGQEVELMALEVRQGMALVRAEINAARAEILRAVNALFEHVRHVERRKILLSHRIADLDDDVWSGF
jgi:uncharacterized small protein (DUF1192 family)